MRGAGLGRGLGVPASEGQSLGSIKFRFVVSARLGF